MDEIASNSVVSWEEMVRLWTPLFDGASLQPDSDFFELGGDSMAAVSLCLDIEAEFCVYVTADEFLRNTTLARLSAYISDLRARGVTSETGRGRTRIGFPADRSRANTLSFMQAALWRAGHHPDSHVKRAFLTEENCVLRGALDVERFQRALDAVVVATEILRTAFTFEGGNVVPSIAGNIQALLHYESLVAEPGVEDPMEEARERIHALRSAPFDIATPPLFRVQLIQTRPEEHVLAVCIDHLISDATTVRLFVQKLLDEYDRLDGPGENDGQVSQQQYWHYAAWETLDAEAEVTAISGYWEGRFASTETQPLPFDFSPGRPIVNESKHFTPEPELAARIREFSVRERCFPLGVGLAAMQIAIQRVLGVHRTTTNLLLDARPTLGLDGLMGPLLGFSFAQLDINAADDFRSLCQAAVGETHTALRHMAYSPKFFPQSLKWGREKRSEMPVLNWIQDTPYVSRALESVELFEMPARPPSGAFGFVFAVHEGEADLRLRLDYATDLFDEDTIERLGRSFLSILTHGVVVPDASRDSVGLEEAFA